MITPTVGLWEQADKFVVSPTPEPDVLLVCAPWGMQREVFLDSVARHHGRSWYVMRPDWARDGATAEIYTNPCLCYDHAEVRNHFLICREER